MTESVLDQDRHVTDYELAALLDGKLPADERDRVQRHMARCAECREDLLDSGELLRVVLPRRRFLVWAMISAAIILVIAAIIATYLSSPR